MLRHIAWLGTLLAAAAFAAPAYAQQGSTMGPSELKSGRLRYSLWSSEISADLEVTSGTTFGTEFSLNELGMDKKETVPVWEFEMWDGSFRLDISYWENKWEGFAQTSRDIAFEGVTYSLSAVLDSTFKMRMTDVSLTMSLSRTPEAAFGLVGGLKYIEYYAKLWEVSTGMSANEHAIAPVPYVGVTAEFLVGETTVLGGRFVMFQYAYSGTNVDVGNFYQADAYIEYRPEAGVALRVGFHNIHLSYENHTPGDRFKITQMLRGTYAAVYVSF
jgi:hypothetical protein